VTRTRTERATKGLGPHVVHVEEHDVCTERRQVLGDAIADALRASCECVGGAISLVVSDDIPVTNAT